MKSKKEVRIENLKNLINEAGGRKEFTNRQEATEQGISYNYVGQLVNGSRGIGDSTAVKLEIIGRKPKYWLDQPHFSINEQPTKYETTPELTEWINAFDKLNEAQRKAILTIIKTMPN